MASKVPCIVTGHEKSEISKILTSDTGIYLYNPTASLVSEKIIELSQEKEKSKILGENARTKIIEMFSKTKVLNNFNEKINAILKQVGSIALVYGQQKTIDAFTTLNKDKKREFYNYLIVNDFEDSDIIEKVKEDDLFIFLSSRKQTVSFDYHIDNMPKTLNKNNEFTSFIVFYPESLKSLSDAQITEMTVPAIQENIEKVIHLKDKIKDIFKGEK
jgi:hypothetical protein